MKIPLWDDWIFGGDVFLALLPSFRILWLAGAFGSGKTVFATLLSALLIQRGLAARLITNITIRGASPAAEFVPDGQKYYCEYLKKWFMPGEQLPVENAVILLDEAALFLDDWSSAKDYVAALRKTNLYLLMPSVWSPVARLRGFEVRRTLNWYGFGVPAWQFTWFLSNGKTVAEKGQFILWRPHRIFGVSETSDFPQDDGGIVDAISYTFGLDKLRENRAAQSIKRKIITFGGGAFSGGGGESADIGASIASAAVDAAENFDSQSAWNRRANGKRK